MLKQTITGWIFDAYPEKAGVRIWIIDRDGNHYNFLDAWRVGFYLSGDKLAIEKAKSFLRNVAYPVSTRWVERTELFSNQTISVLEVRVPPLARDKLVNRLKDTGVTLFSADMHLIQAYHYDRGHFPLALCDFEIEDRQLVSWHLKDDPWALDYELPPLNTMHLALSDSEVAGKVDPNHRLKGKLILTMDNRSYELEGSNEDQLESLAQRIRQWDPDVITSDWGDSVLMPQLDRLSQEVGVNIPFSRDAERTIMGKRGERSFYTYGRVIYQNSARYLFGRWHLDMRNSFMLRETGTVGLFEIARIARIPVQRAARCTIGTSLSSMQMAWAWAHGILIPMDKQQAEDFRLATDFLVADKGGLVYEPEVGWHENVAEYDFTSMYPEMMVRHNISPETVNCSCCPENLVPEIGHNLCKRRQGLVPAVLAPILEKRAKLKVLSKSGVPRAATYKAMATAHKWCLVCCFGYLGFKNARFGKIESHESVTAWGREVLLRAKDVVERRGFQLLHALVDALWIKVKPDTDLEELRLAIEREAECPLGLEGVYKWIRYCASKEDSKSGVPNRYFGAFQSGELKIRGIASRRHDTPQLFKSMQKELLDLLNQASDLNGCRKLASQAQEIVEGYRYRLREGDVTAQELAITFNLSKDPQEYKVDTVSTIAAKQLEAAGIKLHPGETVKYVITANKDKVKEWRSKPISLLDGGLEYDVEKYLELLNRAADEILSGLTIDQTINLNVESGIKQTSQMELDFDKT